MRRVYLSRAKTECGGRASTGWKGRSLSVSHNSKGKDSRDA